MGAYDTETRGPAFDALRAAHARMGALLEAPAVNLVELAKAFSAIAAAMVEVSRASGRTSQRFDAVARALDLRTPKSALRAFLEG